MGETGSVSSDKAMETSDATTSEEVDVVAKSNDSRLDLQCDDILDKNCNSQRLKIGLTKHKARSVVHACSYEGCKKFFSRPNRLAQHMRTHTGERPFVCPAEDCSSSYARQQHLKRHIETAHQDSLPEEKLKCEMCDTLLSNIYCLKKHMQRCHTRPRHSCEQCGQSFIKQQQLQKHSYVHTGIKPFPCDYPGCEMRCTTLNVLKRHKLTHQKSRYACPHESCQEKFDAYKDLQCHVINSHPRVCDICSRPFRQLRHLKKHRLTHENAVDAYFCTYPACDRYYTQQNNLMTHIKEKHEQLKIYECGVCDKRLSSKQKLIHHIRTHTPTYKRNYLSKKPRKVRKDKGSSRQDFARLLSGYCTDKDEAPHATELETSNEKSSHAGLNQTDFSPQSNSKMQGVDEVTNGQLASQSSTEVH